MVVEPTGIQSMQRGPPGPCLTRQSYLSLPRILADDAESPRRLNLNQHVNKP